MKINFNKIIYCSAGGGLVLLGVAVIYAQFMHAKDFLTEPNKHLIAHCQDRNLKEPSKTFELIRGFEADPHRGYIITDKNRNTHRIGSDYQCTIRFDLKDKK